VAARGGGVDVRHPLDVLIERWRQEPLNLLPGESPDAVIAAFRRIGAIATPDVIDLYRRAGGMPNDMDAACWRLWPLADVINDQDERSAEFGPLFADYMLNCWDYRLKPSIGEVSAVFVDRYDRPPLLVAPSLEAFFAMYIVDAEALLNKAE